MTKLKKTVFQFPILRFMTQLALNDTIIERIIHFQGITFYIPISLSRLSLPFATFTAFRDFHCFVTDLEGPPPRHGKQANFGIGTSTFNATFVLSIPTSFLTDFPHTSASKVQPSSSCHCLS